MITTIELKTQETFWLEKIKDLYDKADSSDFPKRKPWETSEEYYLSLKKYQRFQSCNKCVERTIDFMKDNIEIINKHNIYVKQECTCKDRE